MGNGSSQSVVLAPPRRPGAQWREPRYPKVPPKYIHPQNRVLPKPIAGQRLRSTDNGNILHSAGTIRGLRHGSGNAEAEMSNVSHRGSEDMNDEYYRQMNLRNHRLFHSDPNIASSRPMSNHPEFNPEPRNNKSRHYGNAAHEASKHKYRKKAKAPQPPNSKACNGRINRSDMECRCANGMQDWKQKSRAPPPPPPLPTSPKTNAISHLSKPKQEFQAAAKATECKSPYPANYEKNVHPLEKWRKSQSAFDIRAVENEFRTTVVYDSRTNLNSGQLKKQTVIPSLPDPFQKEIQAVTKKIAENQNSSEKNGKETTNPSCLPKQYYFSDVDAFKSNSNQTQLMTQPANAIPKTSQSKILPDKDMMEKYESSTKNIPHSRDSRSTVNNDENFRNSPLQRFSPNRRRLKFPNRSSSPLSNEKRDSKSRDEIFQVPVEKSDIDVRLRPVLPRKTLDVPTFSPNEAWQALGSDGLDSSSNRSTSEGDEIRDLQDNYKHNKSSSVKRTARSFKKPQCQKLLDRQWTPKQDLIDDSDTSSIVSEEAVIPKTRVGEISTRFSLPTVMFSNMRPIGSEISSGRKISSDIGEKGVKSKQLKKKTNKIYEPWNSDSNTVSNIKRFLGVKNKYLSEEDISVSDSNWTFGQYGLQPKNSKQYSSDLILSDKKKYELVVRNNFGELLGDILVTKANEARNKMHSSDSGNSNFSFYSTEGHMMCVPESDHYYSENSDVFRPIKGRVSEVRKKFEGNSKAFQTGRNSCRKRYVQPNETERKRSLELVRILEDEVRKRRNKEKQYIRQQLQMIKIPHSDDEDEIEDEAYFTEPKSRDGTSPLHMHSDQPSIISNLQRHTSQEFLNRTKILPPLTHWESSPALFQNNMGKLPVPKKYSGSPMTSSPEHDDNWHKPNIVDRWLRKQQSHLQEEDEESEQNLCTNVKAVSALGNKTHADSSENFPKSNNVCNSSKHKAKKKNNIYQQLMDIVRREEKQLSKAEGKDHSSASRESSYSQRESSHLTSSSQSSSYYSSDSSEGRAQEYSSMKSGIPANKEFHTSPCIVPSQPSGSTGFSPQQNSHLQGSTSHLALVQPFKPNRSYRPVPFDVVVPATVTGCRMPGLQEEGHQVQAQVS